MLNIPLDMNHPVVWSRYPHTIFAVGDDVAHIKPVQPCIVRKCHITEQKTLSISQQYSQTATSSYPAVSTFILIKCRDTGITQEFTVIHRQIPDFLSLPINKDSPIVSTKPDFPAIPPLHHRVYGRNSYACKFQHLWMRLQFTGHRFNTSQPIRTNPHPNITFRIREQCTYGSNGDILVRKIQTIESKHRLIGIGRQYTSTYRTNPHHSCLIAQNCIDFITKDVMGRTAGLIINEAAGDIFTHNT